MEEIIQHDNIHNMARLFIYYQHLIVYNAVIWHTFF